MSRYVSLIYFAVGVLVALLLSALPRTHAIFATAEQLGYLTAFVGGLMYSSSFTAATGALLIAHVGDGLNPILAAIIGGSGGLMYDLLIYSFINREITHRPVLRHLRAWLQRHRRLRWTGILTGALVIASPFPDELGIALLDGAGSNRRWFIPLAFGLNVLGILAIVEIF
ncbi:MAG: hypothetical protein HY976_02520 [Candidatus Kerfeldbacteria bacterium]|nr:hypothetical protein [Candidatus Kerfeldbacteria bacterium]